MEQSRMLAGLTRVTIKKHPALIPLLIAIGAGSMMAGCYVLRLATKNPDVSWNKKKNPYPWNAYTNKQYKFYAEKIDYKNLKTPPERPVID